MSEVRRLDGLVPLQRRGAVHLDAQTLEDLDVVIELLVGGLNGGVGRGPHMPRISESIGTFSEVAGSSGGITEKSARPTMTRLRGSKSFQELTIFVMSKSLLCARCVMSE